MATGQVRRRGHLRGADLRDVCGCHRRRPDRREARPTGLRPLTIAAAALGVAILAVAASPSLLVAVLALAVTGAASITFLATGSTSLQLDSEPGFRGRVMAPWTVAFLGSTPIGAPVVGAIRKHAGPRAAWRRARPPAVAAAAARSRSPARAGGRKPGPRPARRSRPATAEAVVEANRCDRCEAGRAGGCGVETRATGEEGSCSTTRRACNDRSISGLESRKSAVARLQAMGVLWTTGSPAAAPSRSTSCGRVSSGSQKKITRSMRPSAIAAPTLLVSPGGARSGSA